MNHYSFQPISFVACDEMKRAAVVCPKPRRLSLIDAAHCDPSCMRPFRWHFSTQQPEICDAKSGNELLDIIFSKGACIDQSAAQVPSSPPFFSGSPPSRVSNPLIQDSRFGDEKFTPISPRAILVPAGLAPSPSSAHKVGCIRTNFGTNPAVRVEGFDCLDRDRRNRSIPALA